MRYLGHRQQQGFTLVEVLVTMVLLSVGLLGLAAMQLYALKDSQGAQLRNLSTTLAYEIGERIRNNRPAALDNLYTIDVGERPVAPPDCEVALCNATQMAAYDLEQWKEALATQLPAGEGAVSRNGDLITVQVFWDERRNEASGFNCNPDDPADLACFSMSFMP